MEPVTLSTADLLTVAGAGAAALILTQFAKRLFNLGRGWARVIALLTGLAVVLVAHFTSANDFDLLEALLAVIVGAQAGLSASATFDTVDSGGLSYEVYEAGAYSEEPAWNAGKG